MAGFAPRAVKQSRIGLSIQQASKSKGDVPGLVWAAAVLSELEASGWIWIPGALAGLMSRTVAGGGCSRSKTCRENSHALEQCV